MSAARAVKRFAAKQAAKKKGCPKCGAGWVSVSYVPLAPGAEKSFVHECRKGHRFKVEGDA